MLKGLKEKKISFFQTAQFFSSTLKEEGFVFL